MERGVVVPGMACVERVHGGGGATSPALLCDPSEAHALQYPHAVISLEGRVRPLGGPRGHKRYGHAMSHRIVAMPVAEVWPHYVNKVERKGRTVEELYEVTRWLTGYTDAEIDNRLEDRITFTDFFATATLNPSASLITGSICGVKVQEIQDPLMQQIRYFDKLVDELAKGKAMEKILRG